jgi:hypothetical protein
MSKAPSLKGRTFGKLFVVRNLGKNRRGQTVWECNCVCGGTTKATYVRLTSGRKKSCGCLKYPRGKTSPAYRHGMKHTLEYELWQKAKKRAKEKGIVFDLGVLDIVIPKVCPILGIELHKGAGRIEPSSPSLDRKNNQLGYTKENSWVVSHKANRLKSDATAAELRAVLQFVETQECL